MFYPILIYTILILLGGLLKHRNRSEKQKLKLEFFTGIILNNKKLFYV